MQRHAGWLFLLTALLSGACLVMTLSSEGRFEAMRHQIEKDRDVSAAALRDAQSGVAKSISRMPAPPPDRSRELFDLTERVRTMELRVQSIATSPPKASNAALLADIDKLEKEREALLRTRTETIQNRNELDAKIDRTRDTLVANVMRRALVEFDPRLKELDAQIAATEKSIYELKQKL